MSSNAIFSHVVGIQDSGIFFFLPIRPKWGMNEKRAFIENDVHVQAIVKSLINLDDFKAHE